MARSSRILVFACLGWGWGAPLAAAARSLAARTNAAEAAAAPLPQLQWAAPAPSAGDLIVSARLLSCASPRAASAEGASKGSGSGSSGGGVSPLAALQVLCAYKAAAPAAPAPAGAVAAAPAPAAAAAWLGQVPALVAARGVPLEQCALGVPLQLPFLVRLAPPPARGPGALPGAPRDVVASVPLVGEGRGAVAQAPWPIAERVCLVQPPTAGAGGSGSGSLPGSQWRRRLAAAAEDGAAGNSGTADCELPRDPGPCAAPVRRWHFDAARGACRRFTYGGCGGNANNFATAAACTAACGGFGGGGG